MTTDPSSLLGKYVVIGITRIDASDTVVEKTQHHGRIALVDPDDGIKIVLSDGEVMTLPPDVDAFEPAKAGIYKLRSTGEEVVDPDFTTAWTISDE